MEGEENISDFGSVSTCERPGIVTARGTTDGLVIRLDGRVAHDNLKVALSDFVNSRKSFLSGNNVALEWVGELPTDDFVDELGDYLSTKFDIIVRSSKLRPPRALHAVNKEPANSEESEDLSSPPRVYDNADDSGWGQKKRSLFDGMDAVGMDDVEVAGRKTLQAQPKIGHDLALWDDPDARAVYGTIRSGQRIETDYTMVVFGDVNSGAEIVAGGDIVVLGTLRGVAHAGAYEESGGGRVIMALNLQATQLRIGSVISRGGSESARNPEVARVEGSNIVVENYNSRVPILRGRF